MKNQSILKTKISLNKLCESIFDDFDVDDEIKNKIHLKLITMKEHY